jgi:hypothetical protein
MLHNTCLQTYTHLLSKEKRGDNRRCVDCSFFLDCTHSSRVMPYLHSSVFSSSGDGASFTFLQYNQNTKLSWRFRSSGMWCCCDWWIVPNVSKSHMPLLSGSAIPTVLDCLILTVRDVLFKIYGVGGGGNRGLSLAEVKITDLHKCVNVYVHAFVYMTKTPFMIQWHECTETFRKPNGGTFKKFRKLKNVLRMRARAHTHKLYISK